MYFEIMQMKYDGGSRLCDEFKYHNSSYWTEHNKCVDFEEYNTVYTGVIETAPNEIVDHILDRIYTKFNFNKPEDYHGASVCVSDVICLILDGKPVYYFVDSIGYRELEIAQVYRFGIEV